MSENAWLKYGKDMFVFKIIKSVEKVELDAEEKKCISFYQNNNMSYNFDSGGHELKTHCKETKDKISNALKGRLKSNETKRRISIGQLGRIHSEDTKTKMRLHHKGMTGKSMPDSAKLSIRNKLLGHIVSKETREKISASCKKRFANG